MTQYYKVHANSSLHRYMQIIYSIAYMIKIENIKHADYIFVWWGL